jgi:WD40 repeat protein
LEPPVLATAVTFTPDGERLIVGRLNGRLEIWQAKEGQLLHQFDLPSDAIMQLLPNGDNKWIMASEDGQIMALNEKSAQIEQALARHAQGAIESLAFDPNTAVLAAGSINGYVNLWDLASQTPTIELANHNGAVQSIAFSPEQGILATGMGEWLSPQAYDDTVRIWQWPKNELVLELGGEKEDVIGCSSFRGSVAFSPDGRFLPNGSHNFTAQVRLAATGEIIRALDDHNGAIHDLAFSPDSSLLATASEDGFVRVWSTGNFEQVAKLMNGIDGVTAAAFSPNGRYLVSGTLLGTIDLWDTHNWKLLRSIESGKNRFSSLAFSPDGSLLAAGVDQGDIQLWSADSLSSVHRLEGTNGIVEAISFSPDGSILAAGSSNGLIQLWGTEGLPESIQQN